MRVQQNSMLAVMAGGLFAASIGQIKSFGSIRNQESLASAVRRRITDALREVARQERIEEARRHLEQLDDHLLQDIGISRIQIKQVVSEGRSRLRVEGDNEMAHAQLSVMRAWNQRLGPHEFAIKNEELCSRRSSDEHPDQRRDSELDAWARHANASNGFGDFPLGYEPPQKAPQKR